jgi:succinylglutamic semialdehyde dehydrogenase
MHYINGVWVDEGDHRFDSVNPATGQVLWRGRAAGAQTVGKAVHAANEAFPAWSALGFEARLAYLESFKQLILCAQSELTERIAQETGKARWDAASEVAAVVAKLAYCVASYQERTGDKSKTSPVGTAALRHRPHGVMAVYGPYNFPAHLPNGHIMPALLAGNTIVFKPSEQTPAVAEWMVRQWEAAGLPPGVLNLVQGERETGISLSKQEVNGILFTGSSQTGKAIHAQLAGRPDIVLALEMGGNNPLIVSSVSDIRAAVYETILSAFTGTGQRCTCARRLIVVQSENSETYIEQLLDVTKTLRIGAFDEDPAPFMGPLISNLEADKILAAQAHLLTLGAVPLLKMARLREGLPFVSPAILDLTAANNIPDTEYFGPMIQLYRVKNLAEAVTIANRSTYGLSASIFSDKSEEYEYVRENIRAGLINWNRQTTGASGAAPFGGVGLSGNARPAGYYAADYCAYPVASVEQATLTLPTELFPGITLGCK